MVIKQLIYLTALAREKHFGRAAQSCHISQPTLSAALRQLEDELGVPIVERGQRFQGFTEEGKRVLEWAQRIVADCDAMRQELAAMTTGLSGRIRLGVIPSALPMVSLLTTPFCRQHPMVSVTVRSLSSIEILRELDEFHIDLGISYLDNEPVPNTRIMPLYQERYILLTPEDGPFAGRERVSWAETANVPLCLLTSDMQGRRIIDSIFRQSKSEPNPRIETNSLTNMLSHIRSGHWSSVMAHASLYAFGVPPGSCAIPLVEPEVTHSVGLVMADRNPPPLLARALFAFAHEAPIAATIDKLGA